MLTPESIYWAPVPAEAVPPPTQRRVTAPHADRIIRQIEAIGAWNTAHRMRERQLAAAATRMDREAAKRQTDALRRAQQAIAACAAGTLARQPGPLCPTATAVIAHRHGWFAEKVTTLLADRGVTVIECTANGADALGAVVAEQPDILLAGDRLAMMPGEVLLAEARLFAPGTVRAVLTNDPPQADAWQTQADAVLLRHHPPRDIADALSALCRAPAMDRGEV